MTINEGYRQVQDANVKQPYLDYPYLCLPDENEEEVLETKFKKHYE